MTNAQWYEQLRRRNAEWFAIAYPALEKFCLQHEAITGELFRAAWKGEEPPSSNAWGALLMLAKKKGLVRDSGQTMLAQAPSSHGRRTVIWVSNVYDGRKEASYDRT